MSRRRPSRLRTVGGQWSAFRDRRHVRGSYWQMLGAQAANRSPTGVTTVGATRRYAGASTAFDDTTLGAGAVVTIWDRVWCTRWNNIRRHVTKRKLKAIITVSAAACSIVLGVLSIFFLVSRPADTSDVIVRAIFGVIGAIGLAGIAFEGRKSLHRKTSDPSGGINT